MGDYHLRICERFGVKLPLSTRLAWPSGLIQQISAMQIDNYLKLIYIDK